MKIRTLVACISLTLFGAVFARDMPTGTEPLKLAGRTELPTYSGDFDHFGANVRSA